ncbi:MAG TPA: DUF4229 domain-containing protein [Pseudonocardiaceae bacterium]
MADANGTDAPTTTEPPEQRAVPEHLGRDLALYTLARIGLVVVIAALLTVAGVPMLIGIGIGVIAAMPLAMVLMRPLHNRVSAGLAARSANRHAERARLRAELRGAPVDQDQDESA